MIDEFGLKLRVFGKGKDEDTGIGDYAKINHDIDGDIMVCYTVKIYGIVLAVLLFCVIGERL